MEDTHNVHVKYTLAFACPLEREVVSLFGHECPKWMVATRSMINMCTISLMDGNGVGTQHSGQLGYWLQEASTNLLIV